MPEKQTIERAKTAKRKGKSASTQAGEFVREEIHHIREGKHGALPGKRCRGRLAPRRKSARGLTARPARVGPRGQKGPAAVPQPPGKPRALARDAVDEVASFLAAAARTLERDYRAQRKTVRERDQLISKLGLAGCLSCIEEFRLSLDTV